MARQENQSVFVMERCFIQHNKELQHSDVKDNDRVFYFTTCGWMMWNWLGALHLVQQFTFDGFQCIKNMIYLNLPVRKKLLF